VILCCGLGAERLEVAGFVHLRADAGRGQCDAGAGENVQAEAPLPGSSGQGGADRLNEAAVGVGGDELDAGQAAGGQVPEERQPPRAVLSLGDLQAQDLPVPISVHSGRKQGVDVDDPATFTDLQHQRIRGHECVRAGVQRPGPGTPPSAHPGWGPSR
jgi:hypothetical protein